MVGDLVDHPGVAYSTEMVMYTQSHGSAFANITKVIPFHYDSCEADACFLQMRPHMCHCKLTRMHVEYRMQEYPPPGAYTVAEMNAALHQTNKWSVMTFQEILDSYPASTLLPILTGALTIDDSGRSGEICVDTPTVKCPKCAVSGRWQINSCTGFLIQSLGLKFPPSSTTDASFQLCTSRIVSSRVFGIDKRNRAFVSCRLSAPFWITDSFWLSAYQHMYKKKTFTHDWRIRCAHAPPAGGVSKVVDHKVRADDASGLPIAAAGLDHLATDAEFVEYWNDAKQLYEYHVSIRTVVQPFNRGTTCIFLLNGERVLSCTHPTAMTQASVTRLEAQKAELERAIRNHEAMQQKASALTRLLGQQRTSALEKELQMVKQDPLYTMSVASYEKEMETVDRSLQATVASARQLASTELVFDVAWSAVFYTNRFDLCFESLQGNARTPHVTMCVSVHSDDQCVGTVAINEACTKFELACHEPFLGKKARFRCSNVGAVDWRIVSVSPLVLSSPYELARPVRLWGDARHDARCTLLQTSPVELEMPLDMCPVHADQLVNTFPIFCPHKPNANAYLWFLDASASWMLVPYKRNTSHLGDKASSILQIGMYLT